MAGVMVAPVVEGTAVPVPDNDRVCGDVLVLSATVRVADSALATDGVSETAIVQLAPTANDVPQLLLVVKSREFGPLRVIPEIEIGPVPLLESTIA